MKKSKTSKIVLFIVILISGCCLIGLFYSIFLDGEVDSTNTTQREIVIPTIAQTQIPEVTNTKIVLPSVESTSSYPTIVMVPTKLISSTPLPTRTTFVLPTATAFTSSQPINPGSSLCTCSLDYNCSDFSSHFTAQTCFNSCGGSSSFNWSQLDSDGDGQACESLP